MSRHCWKALLCLLAVGVGCAETPSESTPLPPGVSLVIESIPSELLMSQSFTVTVVAMRDGTKAEDFTGDVSLSLEGGVSATILSGTTRVAAVRGEAHFSALHIDVMATGLHLRATATGVNPAVSTAFSLAPRFQLSFTAFPAQIRSGQPFDLTVQAVRYSAAASDFAETVTLSLDGAGTTASLSGTTTAKAEAGLAHFTNLRIDGTGHGLRLGATSNRSTAGMSNEFDLLGSISGLPPIAFSECLRWDSNQYFDFCADFGLTLLHPDGSESVIATDPNGIENPVWSPDGRRIAYAGRDCSNLPDYCRSELYLMNADGSGAARLTAYSSLGRESQGPSWSPDGTRIAFSSWVSNQYESTTRIYIMRPDGTGITPLGDLPGVSPAWSPDGTRIAFSSPDNEGRWAVFVANADGSSPTQITHPSVTAGTVANDWTPTWSPNGARMGFSRSWRYPDGHSSCQILIMNADGSNPVQITQDPFCAQSPAWSPDGTQIAYQGMQENSPPSILLVRPDGSGQEVIKRLEMWSTRVAWAPARAGVP